LLDDRCRSYLSIVQFSQFDSRRYRTVDARAGYAEWASTYEQTVVDAMDIALLEQLTEPSWHTTRRAADLGCGTGRTGVWLARHGVASIDGVDLTAEMLAVARSRGVHANLVEGDAASTGLDAEAYDLVIACLVDEHLDDLHPFYREAWRLGEAGACFVLVVYHPHFIMTSGIPTHFTGHSGEPVAIATHVHLMATFARTIIDLVERRLG
jgi:SAM-dependent methyltransferase